MAKHVLADQRVDGYSEPQWPGSAILHWDPTGHTDVDVSLTEAVLRLRAIAYAEDRSINDLAADIVSRRRRLSKEDS